MQRHSPVVAHIAQTDLVKAHGTLAAEVCDQRNIVQALQAAIQSLSVSTTPAPRRAAVSASPFVTSSTARQPISQTPCPQVDVLSSNDPPFLQFSTSACLHSSSLPPSVSEVNTFARPTLSAQACVSSSCVPATSILTPPSNIPVPFLPSSNGSASAESVRIAPVQGSPASAPPEMWHSMQVQQDLRKLVPQPQFKKERGLV